MRARWSSLAVVACVAVTLGPTRSVRAQEDEPAPTDDAALEAPQEGSDDAAFEASLAGSEAPGGEAAWEQPTILVVPQRDTPPEVIEDVRGLLAGAGALIDGSAYEREARSRGLPPESAEAMQAILAELHPDLDLVVVVGTNRATRASLILLGYHDRFGLQILEEAHSIEGLLMTEDSRARTLAETRLALAVITRPRGGLQEIGGGVEPGERAPGLAVHVAIEAGAGFGTRALDVPTSAGVIGLATAVFPSAALQLSVEVEPTARGQLTVGADLEYHTSFALITTDMRIDGTVRETGSRSQRLAAGLRLAYRIEEPLDTVSFSAALAWSALTFSSDAPVSLPDYTLQGPVLALGVVIPIADQLLTVSFFPEVQWIVDVGGALAALGVSSSGVSIGGSARVRLRLLSQLFADLTYRESHAFLSTAVGQGATDVERFASVRLVYRP
ncbi:MAG: hypothetical protein M3Y87_14990 [Myxococcota bacterium]|nr:hypothetical protein [Myxococcota bacterium]